MERIFCYGTLQDPQIQREVFDRILRGISDSLHGYVRDSITIDAVVYACARPAANEVIEGTCYLVAKSDILRADDYEGDSYERVEQTLRSGVRAWVYVARE